MVIINILELGFFVLLIVLIKLIMDLSHFKKKIEYSANKLNILLKQKEQAKETPDHSNEAINQEIKEYNSFVLKYNKLQRFLPNFFLLQLKHSPASLWQDEREI